MRINVTSLVANLPEKQSYLQAGYTPGLFRAVEAAHYEVNSADVDWSSFTLDEAKRALDHAMNYVDQEYAYEEDDGDNPVNQGNVIHEYLLNCGVIHSIKSSKPMVHSQGVEFF